MTTLGVTPLLLSGTSCAAGNGRFWNIHRTHPLILFDFISPYFIAFFSSFLVLFSSLSTYFFLLLFHSSLTTRTSYINLLYLIVLQLLCYLLLFLHFYLIIISYSCLHFPHICSCCFPSFPVTSYFFINFLFN